MITAFRSEFLLLNQRRMWITAGLVTIVFTAFATALQIITAQPSSQGPALPGSGEGMPVELLIGPGGATAAVSWSIFGFGFILLLALFTSRIGNEFTRGTFRTALLHHPNRWSLIGGKMTALMAIAIVLIVVGFATGAITATLAAPSQGIETTGWFGAEAFRQTAADLMRTLGWALGWALIATTLAVLIRSVPIALGAGVMWFGPVENVIGEGQAFAQRWFPGLLLQQIVAPDTGSAVSTEAAAVTLAVYGLAMVGAIVFFFKRLDVTS